MVTFAEMERAGWDQKASAYAELAGTVTAQAVAPLLDRVRTTPGARLLDLACGPGHATGAAAAAGFDAIGVDLAPGMIAEAERAFPNTTFRQGDAENLPFGDRSFDAVICAFGILHLPDPDRALREIYRVLEPGGRFAFTVWTTPDKHDFFSIVMSAIRAHGDMDAPLPPAPPLFRFSDPAECERALGATGFEEVVVEEVPLVWRPTSPEQVLEMIYGSTVRTAALLEYQTPANREAIHRAIIESAARYRKGDRFELMWPAVLTSTRKPSASR